MKLVVIGGNGYVGSAICQAAIKNGLNVTSFSRSIYPIGYNTKKLSEKWIEKVDWQKGDASDINSIQNSLKDADFVITTLGAFGNNDFMEKVNGDYNINVTDAAKKTKNIKIIGLVSAAPSTLPESFLKGYYNGKKRAKNHLISNFPNESIIVQPSFIYGSRQVSDTLSIPLWIAGIPMSFILRLPLLNKLQYLPVIGSLLVPPIPVEMVADTLVNAVLGRCRLGVHSVDDMFSSNESKGK